MADSAIIVDLQREMFGDPVHLYCLAGNATFTIRSTRTGTRFTYKIRKSDPHPRFGITWWVNVMTGSDNEDSFQTIGMLKAHNGNWDYIHLKPTRERHIAMTAPSVVAFRFFWDHLDRRKQVHEGLEFFHSGRCGKCGRKLTVPESIQSGFGPECIGKLGG